MTPKIGATGSVRTMHESFLTTILPQLAAGAAHTGALGFTFDGLHDGQPRIRVPWREDLVGDPDSARRLAWAGRDAGAGEAGLD